MGRPFLTPIKTLLIAQLIKDKRIDADKSYFQHTAKTTQTSNFLLRHSKDTPLNTDWFPLVVLTFDHKSFLTGNRHGVNEVLQDH